MESKSADVFSFAMLAVEVFTGAPPLEGRTPAKAAYDILRGERPEMPGNAQAIGLTTEMWMLLENCWQQDPEERPTMGGVVRRWRTFVEDSDDDNVVPECVQTTPVILFRAQFPMIDLGIHYQVSDSDRAQADHKPNPQFHDQVSLSLRESTDSNFWCTDAGARKSKKKRWLCGLFFTQSGAPPGQGAVP